MQWYMQITKLKGVGDKTAELLKKIGIETGVTVVASKEKPFCREKISAKESIKTKAGEELEFTKITPASTPFVASCAGIFMASYIVQELIKGTK